MEKISIKSFKRAEGFQKVFALVLFPLFFIFPSTANAQLTQLMSSFQNPAVPDTLNGWTANWDFNLNGSQASYSNWAKGGSNSVSVNGQSLFQLLFRKDRFSYEFRIRPRYGQTRIKEKGVRKTADQLNIRHRFLQSLSDDNGNFRLFGNIDFETQFDKGYKYGDGPDGTNLLISEFMSPAFLVENAGLAWIPADYFLVETGLGFKQTIVLEDSLRERYGLNVDNPIQSEAGYTLGMNFEKEIFENVTYHGYLETFTSFLKPLSGTDVTINHEMVGKINSFLNATFKLELVYNDDYSEKWQVSQLLSAGISVNLF